MNDLKKPTTLLLFVSFLAVFFVVIFFSSLSILKSVPPPIEKVAEAPVLPPVILTDPFENISLEAEAAYVLDVRTGKVFFARNGEAQLPLASLTKVMTAYVASRVSEDSSVASLDGEKWGLKELLDYMLVVSSNNGASAIAGAGGALFSRETEESEIDDTEFFIQKMNEEARMLSLSQTFYLNPSGLDIDSTLSGAYGSAKDMALLFAHILKTNPAIMEATTYDSLPFSSLSGTSYRAENTNIVARTIPGLLASKTGYTDLAGGNLVIAFDVGPARPVVVAVLGSSQNGRFTDVGNLVAASVEKIGQGR